MKNKYILCIFLSSLVLFPTNSSAVEREEADQNQATTQVQLILRRKISPGNFPGDTPSVNDIFVSPENALVETKAQENLQKMNSSYSIAEKRLPKTGTNNDSWVYSGMGIVTSAFVLFLLGRKKKGADE
ncbi:LPXTG cell wall anchor domain-containing protein [Enterococcus faecalis]